MEALPQNTNQLSSADDSEREKYRKNSRTVLLLILLISLLTVVTEIIFSTPVGVPQGGYTEADLMNIKNLETLRGISRSFELAAMILIGCWFVIRNWGQHKLFLLKILVTSELRSFVVAFAVLVLITIVANLFI